MLQDGLHVPRAALPELSVRLGFRTLDADRQEDSDVAVLERYASFINFPNLPKRFPWCRLHLHWQERRHYGANQQL